MDAVTQILIDRSRETQRIGQMVLIAFVAHVAMLAAIAYLPRHWLTPHTDSSTPMMISLGGAPGPRQGQNAISEKAIQEVAPPTAKPKAQAPPALTKPEMVEPTKTAKREPKAIVKNDTSKTQPQLHGRTPTTGPETRQGAARVETGGRQVPFGGLATGGGGGAGAAYTDVANFCCPEYLSTLVNLIHQNWKPNQGQAGSVIVKFTIVRNGRLTDVEVEKTTAPFLSMASQRAVLATAQVPPLPPQFTGDHLTIHLVFQYQYQ